MALQYNHLVSQEEFIRGPKIRVYTYERFPSRETKPEDCERYPKMYKIFNNKPSFRDDPNASRVSPSASQIATLPNNTVEYVKYGGDLGNMTQRPASPQPQDHMIPRRETTKFEVYKTQQTRMPVKTVVEPVKYEEVGHDCDENKGLGFGEGECINAAAAGFIEWKKRTMQFCY